MEDQSLEPIATTNNDDNESDDDEPVMIQKRVPKNLDRKAKTCSIFTKDAFKEVMEKHGYLFKQGGHVKSWKRRYFVLRDRQLYYYKNEEGFERGELLGCISLTGFDAANQTELKGEGKKQHVFEIHTPKRYYHFCADSKREMFEWLDFFQNIMKRSTIAEEAKLEDILNDESAVMKGWLVKQKRGFAATSWFSLQRNILSYCKAPNDEEPLGQIELVPGVSKVEMINADERTLMLILIPKELKLRKPGLWSKLKEKLITLLRRMFVKWKNGSFIL